MQDTEFEGEVNNLHSQSLTGEIPGSSGITEAMRAEIFAPRPEPVTIAYGGEWSCPTCHAGHVWSEEIQDGRIRFKCKVCGMKWYEGDRSRGRREWTERAVASIREQVAAREKAIKEEANQADAPAEPPVDPVTE
jgi:hypothetical protein